MIDNIIRFSLTHRYIVVLFALAIFLIGANMALQIPIDALPDLTAPTVTLMTDIHGMAPEEVEALITRPIERAVKGAPGVRRVRSNSTFGLSTIWVEFNGGTNIYLARQIVNEKVQLVASTLPAGAVPTMGAITSIMGEVMTIGLYSPKHSMMFLKELADFTVRKRLLSIPGVSQVVIVGGETKEFRINIDQNKLKALNVSLAEVSAAALKMNENFSAGMMKANGQDYLIRGMGRVKSISDLEESVVITRNGTPILMKDIASVTISPAFRIGDTSVNGRPALLISVLKHPQTNTMELTRLVDESMEELQKTLPEGAVIDTQIFRQATFIQRAIDNVNSSLLDACILVVLILVLFLGNLRTSVISLVSIPMSLIVAIFAFKLLGLNLNTMTLGGIAIAIGLLVDDAVIDVDNILRSLHENLQKPPEAQQSVFEVMFQAIREIRLSIINANLILIVVFIPLFFLSGVEGRLLMPLGTAYIAAVFGSLLVVLLLTPALCSILLNRDLATIKSFEGESFVIRILKKIYSPFLNLALRLPWLIIILASCAFAATMLPLSQLGRSFLPMFNEGSLMIKVTTAPGTSLEKAAEVASIAEGILLKHPNVLRTSRKTGRGENDEHGKFSNESEIDAILDFKKLTLPEILADLRQKLSIVPGAKITFSQPLSHRIDHMLSGTMANIAIKTYGQEFFQLRNLNDQIYNAIKDVPGLVDIGVEQQIDISQIRINPIRHELAKYGVTIVDLAHVAELALEGLTVSTVLDGEKEFNIVLKFPDEIRQNIEAIKSIEIDTPMGVKVPLSTLANVVTAKGPYMVNRENAQRRILVQANVAGRDLRSVYEDVKSQIEKSVIFPKGYFVSYGGQFESEAEATRMIGLLSIVSFLLILLLLFMEFGSYQDSFIVMVSLPLSMMGGILAIYFTSGILNVSSLVGFITLFGIATRNGIVLVDRYNRLMKIEGKNLMDAVRQGSTERLRPVLMTSLSTFLGLLPFAIGGDVPGNEILSPLAIVISGGMFSSTLLNQIMIPALYLKFGSKPAYTPTCPPSN